MIWKRRRLARRVEMTLLILIAAAIVGTMVFGLVTALFL
jgi:hypothetical protein